MWSLGDYSQVSPHLEACAQELAEVCEITTSTAVLDVAAGDGNFALAAARFGARVTACDYAPRMLELGRARTDSSGVEVTWVEGDAEELPFPDGSYDLVSSVFGAMFAPRPEIVAAELFRVCGPGGVVAMANYGWDGFLGDYAKLLARYSSPPPFDLPSPFEWGEAEVVNARFARFASSVELQPRQFTLEIGTGVKAFEFWERTNGPTIALRSVITPDRYESFRAEAVELMGRSPLTSSYLIVLARR